MQTSRVNGLTSGVFAFLVPASCLNQKGSDTRRDNTTFLSGYDDLHAPAFIAETPGAGKTCFSRFRVGQLSNAKASVSGVLPHISNSRTTTHRRFFQNNGDTPDVVRQYFPAESGRKRKRARRQPYPFFIGVRQFQPDFPDF